MKTLVPSVIHAGVPNRLDTPTLNNLLPLDRQSPGSVLRLVDIFRRDHGHFLSNARSRLVEGDFETLRSGLHTLKGSAASLGASRLSQLATLAERRAEQRDKVGMNACLTTLETELELSCEALRRIFGAESAHPG